MSKQGLKETDEHGRVAFLRPRSAVWEPAWRGGEMDFKVGVGHSSMMREGKGKTG